LARLISTSCHTRFIHKRHTGKHHSTKALLHPTNNFDGLRLFAAWLVLFSHSWDLLGPSVGPEPLARFVGIDTLGAVAVITFFVISGYLVTQSLERSISLTDFVWRRALRILPALWFVVLLSVLVIGPLCTLVPSSDYWGHNSTWNYLLSLIINIRHRLVGVFEGNPYPGTVNGSLWTLPIEVRMYCIVFAIGCCPRRWWPKAFAGVFALFIVLLIYHLGVKPIRRVLGFSGSSIFVLKLAGPFMLGACIAYFKWERCLRIGPSALAVAVVIAAHLLLPSLHLWTRVLFPSVVAWCALSIGYATWPVLSRIGAHGDFSYGFYLWAYPVQQLVLYTLKPSEPLQLVWMATLLTLPLAILSWKLVEEPALRLKTWRFWARGHSRSVPQGAVA
jgi:peptidoglycan/LPS O-acetylase OafA/YrhL